MDLVRRLPVLALGPLLVVAAALLAAGTGPDGTSWHFFHDAARLLFDGDTSGGGLDLYVAHPDFQFGPLATVAAAPFALLPAGAALTVALVAGTALGAVAAAAARDVARTLTAGATTRAAWRADLVGYVTFAFVWTDVAVNTAHLDDAIALAATAVACAAVARDRAAMAVVALTVAAAAKPWAIVFAPLALVPSGERRPMRLLLIAGGVLATWVPFLVDEPRTLTSVGAFGIRNAPASALRVLGVTDPTTPGWVRPAQFALGLAVAAVLVRRDRWPAVPMAGLAVRFALDPGVHHYYSAGLVLAVLIWEGVARPGRAPLVTVAAALVMELTPTDVHPGALAGAVRLAFMAALVVAAFATPLMAGSSEPGSVPRNLEGAG